MSVAFLGGFGSHVSHFFVTLDHRVSTIGLAAIALALGAVLAYFVLWTLSRYRRTNLAAILQPYHLGPEAGAAQAEPVLTVPALQRLSTGLQAPLTRTRFGLWLDDMLERAGSRLRLGELLTVWALGGLLFLAVGFLVAGLVGLLMFLVLAIIVPLAVLQGFVEHRARLFAAQLPDVLKLTASSLRAGFSLAQGLDSVTRQVRDPSKEELQRVLAEARLGRPLDEALEEAAARIRNRDFSESVAAVGIQQETGGNLAALFDLLADTMVQRVRLRREVRTLTAEGRLSAYVLGIMPLALGVFIFFVNRSYEMVLFNTTPGKIMLVVGLVLMVAGFFWMYKTVKIDT